MSDLEKGIQCVGQAIQLDSEGNLERAIEMYQLALDHFQRAFHGEGDLQRKQQILEKMQEYHERMQLLHATVTSHSTTSVQQPEFPSVHQQQSSPVLAQQMPSPNVSSPVSQPQPPRDEFSNQPNYSPTIVPTQSDQGRVRASTAKAPYDQPNEQFGSSPYANPYAGTVSLGGSNPGVSSLSAPQPQSLGSPSNFYQPTVVPSDQSPVQQPPSSTLHTQSDPRMSQMGSFQSPTSFQTPVENFGGMQSFQMNPQQMNAYNPNQMNPQYNPQGSFSMNPSVAPMAQPTNPPSQQYSSFGSNAQVQQIPPSQFTSPQMSSQYNPSQLNRNSSSAVQPPRDSSLSSVSGIDQTPSGQVNAFLVKTVNEHPRDKPDLQVALMIADEAKRADRSRQYQDALDLYNEALERFLVVYNGQNNQNIKQSLRNTIDSYMQRAEKIKDACKIVPRRVPDASQPSNNPPSQSTSQPRIQQDNRASVMQQRDQSPARVDNRAASNTLENLNNSSYFQDLSAQPIRNSDPFLSDSPASSGANLRGSGTASRPPPQNQNPFETPNITQNSGNPTSYVGKPIQIANETKSLIQRQTLRLAVSVKNNLVFPGDKLKIYVKVDNRSSMVVNFMKVTLRKLEREQKYDHKGRLILANNATKIHRQEFYQGSIFPLTAENNYTGELLYTIPHGLAPTNTSQPGVFEREYDLSVQCDLSRRKNLKVRFPLVIGPS